MGIKKEIQTIFNLEPTKVEYNGMIVKVVIKYLGKNYCGYASCATEDQDVFSEKVGKRLAFNRAILEIFKDRYNYYKNNYAVLNNTLKPYWDNCKMNYEVHSRINKELNKRDTFKSAIEYQKNAIKQIIEDLDNTFKAIRKVKLKEKDNKDK